MKNRNLQHRNDWRTPADFYAAQNAKHSFDFDPCPFMHDMSWCGLEVEWGNCNWVNPGYSLALKTAFVKKGIAEAAKGKKSVFLLPVSTSTILYHDYILPNIKEPIDYLRGRLKFSGWNCEGVWAENKTGMHDSMLVIF